MADDTYLSGQADLRLTRTGQIVGTTPYFSLFVGDGDRAIPPVSVELFEAFTPRGEFPGGVSEFATDEDRWEGLFALALCHPTP